jgi:hypothetical protein
MCIHLLPPWRVGYMPRFIVSSSYSFGYWHAVLTSFVANSNRLCVCFHTNRPVAREIGKTTRLCNRKVDLRHFALKLRHIVVSSES